MEAPKMRLSQQQMADLQIPLHWRDYCAHILAPLNKCRRENKFSPFHCEHELHEYEICMYQEYERRRAIKKTLTQNST